MSRTVRGKRDGSLKKMRICKVCNQELLLTQFEFYITPAGERKERWQCRKCKAKKNRELYHKNHAIKCSSCGKFKQPIEFVLERSLDYKAYGKICRDCAFEKNREIKKKKPKREIIIRTKKKIRDNGRSRYRETKKAIIKRLGNVCAICGGKFCWYAYDFHHRDSKEKECKISRFFKYSLEQLKRKPEFKEELNKCILVCAICHRKIHIKEGEEYEL